MFGGGKFWEKFVKAGFRVVLLQMGLHYLPMDCFDSCRKDNTRGACKRRGIFGEYK